MTKEQALQLIDQVLAGFRGTRADHQALIEAITLVRKLLEENNATTTKTKGDSK